MSELTASGDWDSDFEKKKEFDNSNEEGAQKRLPWMKFEQKGQYQVRLIGKFVKFHRWWSPFITRIITHLSYKDQDKAWNSGFWPRQTFAIHIFDRGDVTPECPTGTLKILEKGSSVFEAFSSWKKVNGENPAGKGGHDFVINVDWPGSEKRQAKYTVVSMAKPSPFTEGEINYFKANHADLTKVYGPTPLEEINAAWDALPDDAKVPPVREGDKKRTVASATVTVAPVATTPIPEETVNVSDDQDLFGDSNDSTGF
jgi:hypothetical protein